MAIILVAYPLKTGMIVASDDSTFNVQRLTEVFQSLRHFQLPQLSAYSAYPMGVATATMYPWLIFVLFTPFSIILKPIELWYLIVFIGLIIGEEIAYFSFENVEHMRKLGGALFALLYCNSYVLLGWLIHNSDIGTMYAMFFAPLAFAGWVHYRRDNHWKMMVIGLLLMSCCHVISTVVMLTTLFIVTLIEHRQFKPNYIRTGIKAFIIFLIADAFIWLPIFVMLVFGESSKPYTPWASNIKWLFPPLKYLIMPFYLRAWDYIDLIALVFFIGYWRNLPQYIRGWVCVAIGCVFLNSDMVWTFLFYETPMRWLQNAYRFNFITELVSTWILAIVIAKILPTQSWWTFNRISNVIISLMLLLVVGGALTDYEMFDAYKNSRRENRFNLAYLHGLKHYKAPLDNDYNLLHDPYIKHDKICFDYFPKKYVHSYMRWNVRSMHKQIRYKIIHSNRSYTPENNRKLVNNFNNNHSYNSIAKVAYAQRDIRVIRYVNHASMEAHYMNHGLRVYVPKDNMKLLMPITIYKCQEYHITNNNHKVRWKSHYGAVQINNLHKGWHKIQYHAPIMWYRYVAFALTLIGLMLLLIMH